MFETKPISCSAEARKCRCSILFLLNLQDLFLPLKALVLTTLWSRLIGVLAQEMSSLFRDDFVTIIQVSRFCAASARGHRVGQHGPILCSLTWSLPRSHFAEYSPDLYQHDIALNEINIFDQWNIFASLNLTQSLWSVTVVEIVQVKWSILIEFTFSTASVSNIRREIIRIWQHASCSPQQCSKSYVTLNLLSEVLQDFMPNYTRS